MSHAARKASPPSDSGATPRRDRVVFTRRLRTFQLAIVVVLGTTLSIGPTSEFAAGNVGTARLAIAVVALVFVLFGYRVARLAVIVRADVLVVRNVFWTYRIPRSDIAVIEPPPRYGRAWKAGLRIRRCSGRTVSASAFVQTPADLGRTTASPAEALIAWAQTGEAPRPPVRRRSLMGVILWWLWLTVLGLVIVFALSIIISGLADPNM